MQLDKHFMYLPSMTFPVYSEVAHEPVRVAAMMSRMDELEESAAGVVFDTTTEEGDLFGHPEANALLEAFDERGIPVTLRVAHHRLKACKSTLERLCERGWVSEIRCVASLDEIEKSGGFQTLLKFNREALRRLALEVDLLTTQPSSLDALAKPILPAERRDTDIEFNAARALSLPRILLRLDPQADPFDPAFESSIRAWRTELSGLLRVTRIAFDMDAYQALQPHRIASFTRPVERRSPVFLVVGQLPATWRNRRGGGL